MVTWTNRTGEESMRNTDRIRRDEKDLRPCTDISCGDETDDCNENDQLVVMAVSAAFVVMEEMSGWRMVLRMESDVRSDGMRRQQRRRSCSSSRPQP